MNNLSYEREGIVMRQATKPNPDAYSFFRARAAQLLEEGYDKQALRLLTYIDQQQVRMVRHCIKELRSVSNR